METMDILLRIENRLGKHEAMLEAIQEDTKDTRSEAKYTNGKVRKLVTEMETAQNDIKALYQSISSLPHTHIEVKKQSIFSMSWEKLLFILGSVATLIAFVIEKIT